MPQGCFKNKKGAQKPASLKKGQKFKPSKVRRGKVIAPKKAKAIESMVVQKKLQKAINASIEEDMKERASRDTTGFKLFKKEKKPDTNEKKK